MTTQPDPRFALPSPSPHRPAPDLDTFAEEDLRRIYGPEAEPLGPVLEQLRQEYGDVAPALVPGGEKGEKAWVVLGYAAVREVMQRTGLELVCDSRRSTLYQQGRITADHPLGPMTRYQEVLPFQDGDAHQRLREAVHDGLSFNWVRLRKHVARYANRLIDDFAPRGTADLVAEYAAQLPALTLAWMYGLSEEESPAMVAAVRDLTSANERAAEADAWVTRTMQDLVRRRQAGEVNPHRIGGQDFVTRLLHHRAGLSEPEIVQHLRMVFVAGYTPTVAAIENALVQILTEWELRQSLSSGGKTVPQALNDVMWEHPPISLVPTRYAAGDIRVGSKRQWIRKGDMVVLAIEAANADPAARESGCPVAHNSGHLAFGTGPHECAGKDVGLAIAEEGIDTLLDRLNGLQLAPGHELHRQSAWVSTRLEALPVQFQPEKPAHESVPPTASTPPTNAAMTTTASTQAGWAIESAPRGAHQ